MHATVHQLVYIRDLLQGLGESEVGLCDEYEVETLEDLSLEQAHDAIEDLKVMRR